MSTLPPRRQDALRFQLEPEEAAYVKAESEFITYYLAPMSDPLGLGYLRFAALRDTTVLVGFSADRSRMLMGPRHGSLKDVVSQLT